MTVNSGELRGQQKPLMFPASGRHTHGIYTLEIFTVAHLCADKSVSYSSKFVTFVLGSPQWMLDLS